MQHANITPSDEAARPLESSSADQTGRKRARLTGREVSLRVAAMAGRMPKYLRLAYRLVGDQRLGRSQRILPLAGAAYVVSPVDAVPGIIPVFGQLDDLAVMLLSLRQAIRLAPADIAAEHLEATGVTLAALDTDLATVGEIARWFALKAAGGLGRLAGALVRMGSQRAGPLAPASRHRAVPSSKSA